MLNLGPEETDLVGRLSHSPVSFSLSKVISSPSSPIYAPRSSKLTAGAQAQVCFNRNNLIQSHILNLGISDRCFFREIRDFVTGFHKRKKKRRKEAQKQQEESLRRKRIEARKKVRIKPLLFNWNLFVLVLYHSSSVRYRLGCNMNFFWIILMKSLSF